MTLATRALYTNIDELLAAYIYIYVKSPFRTLIEWTRSDLFDFIVSRCRASFKKLKKAKAQVRTRVTDDRRAGLPVKRNFKSFDYCTRETDTRKG